MAFVCGHSNGCCTAGTSRLGQGEVDAECVSAKDVNNVWMGRSNLHCEDGATTWQNLMKGTLTKVAGSSLLFSGE